MSTNKTKTISSIKISIISMVLLISTIALLVAFVINGIFEVKQQKENLTIEAEAYANIIGLSSVNNLKLNNAVSEEENLKALVTVKNIENVHIYKYDLKTETSFFFASYNKINSPPIPSQLAKLSQLHQPTFKDSYLEYITEITQNNEIIGHIYLRFSLASLNNNILTILYLKLAVLFISLGIALALAIRFQRNITEPISDLVQLFKHVAKEKNYSVRAPRQSLTELNGLSLSFNTMLDRIQANLEKQKEAEAQIIKLNQNLEDKINQRTNALKESNKELMDTLETLHRYQNQLVETEKMASLGDMVAGIAHEVNTPIGLGVTASTLMQDRLKEIQNALTDKVLTANQLSRFLAESDENLSIIYRNLNRAAELISSFKQVAVDQSHENARLFNVRNFIGDVLLSLRPKLKPHQHTINIICDENLTIESKPGPLNQILINLIMNSLIHGFEHIKSGTITIKIKTHDNKLNLNYRDNGKGVNEQLKKRIFDPFVTTKRGEGGSGLGMHLVYNLVTQALKGSITIISEEGKGIEFDVLIPINVKKVTN